MKRPLTLGTAAVLGAGAFLALSAKAETVTAEPDAFLEYVESDGAYDYVNLDVLANAGIEMETTMEWQTLPGERALVGARHVIASDNMPRVFPYSTFSTYENEVLIETQHAYHYNTSRYTARDERNVAVPIEKNVIYKVASRLEKGAQRITVWKREDGAWVKLGERSIGSSDDINLGIPLYLFAINEDNLSRFFVKARVYRLKLSTKQQDGSYALVRDYVPVRDPVTGGGALWDKLSETYFRNRGKYQLAGGGAERPFFVSARVSQVMDREEA